MRPDTMKRNRTGDKGKTLEKNNSNNSIIQIIQNVGLWDVIALILRSSKAASFPSFFVIMFF